MNMIYTRTARFDDNARALTEDEMRAQAPSIFATTPHRSRSEWFTAIPTIEVLRALAKEGFVPVGVKQSRARSYDRAPYTKHLIRLRKLGEDRKYSVGDTVFEALLKNANDGSSVYDLMGGLFRIGCLNSLVALIATLEAIKVRHMGDAVAKVVAGSHRLLGLAEQALSAPQDWVRIPMVAKERNAFAEEARALRFKDTDGNVTTPITPAQLLSPRRESDQGTDLWTTFNVVQENAIKGGLEGVRELGDGRRRRIRTREIKAIDSDVKLNRGLWTLAADFAKANKVAVAA